MSERQVEQDRRVRPPIPEYDRFGFKGHFEPCCGPSEDRSSAAVLRELNNPAKSTD
jgi:hypothetical protein